MEENLTQKHCKPCEGGGVSMTVDQANQYLKKIHSDWTIENNNEIKRRFQFKNFYRTMGFVNAIAWIANQENHHPDLSIGYNYCLVRLTTHALKGLSENDFILAAKIDQL